MCGLFVVLSSSITTKPSRLSCCEKCPKCTNCHYRPVDESLSSVPDFNLFHMIAVGLSSSILGCLVTLLVYSYCQRYQQQSHDATVIHPISAAPLNTSITNHINKLDKYDTVEAIKVCRQMCSGFIVSQMDVQVQGLPL